MFRIAPASTERGPLCRRCGCPSRRHMHYRAGIDCGTCGRAVCPSYVKPAGRLSLLVSRFFGRRHHEEGRA